MVEKIPESVLARPVNGLNLDASLFRDQLGDGATLLVFLRHFGCMFCREVVRDLRVVAESTPDFPKILFVYQGSREQGRYFFGRHWPGVSAIADEPKFFYRGFGLKQGGLRELAGRGVWTAGLRAMGKGNRMGMPIGDPLTMPGYFVVKGSEIIWSFHPELASDHPEFSKIPSWVR